MPVLLLLGVIVAMAVLILPKISAQPIAVPNDHAVEKHGEDAVAAYQCITGEGSIQGKYTRSADGRVATICEMNSVFYVVLEEKNGDAVTAFKKDKLKCLAQVLNYINNRGYGVPAEQLTGCLGS
jgi:hypothetical protein